MSGVGVTYRYIRYLFNVYTVNTTVNEAMALTWNSL